MQSKEEHEMNQTRLDKVFNLLNVKSMLLSSLLDRTEERSESRVVLTEHERDLLIIMNNIKDQLKGN